jgi:NADH:ubiquinone oxidoreductase subunit
MGILSKIFTWWDGATIGTSIYSWRKGKAVGADALGNRYYQSSDGKRRWVIYNGPNDASRVAPVGMAGCMAHMMAIRRAICHHIAAMKPQPYPI